MQIILLLIFKNFSIMRAVSFLFLMKKSSLFFLPFLGAVLLLTSCVKEEVPANFNRSTTKTQLRSTTELEIKILGLVEYLETQDSLSQGALYLNLLDTIESISLINSLDSLGYLDLDTTESLIFAIQEEIEMSELSPEQVWNVVESLESNGGSTISSRPGFFARIFYCRGCLAFDVHCMYILWIRVVGQKGCD